MTKLEKLALGRDAAIRYFDSDIAAGLPLIDETYDTLRARASTLAAIWWKNADITPGAVTHAMTAFENTYKELAFKAKARADFFAKPLFDGTEASCRTKQEFWALDAMRTEVMSTMAEIDRMADYIARKMVDIKETLRRKSTETLELKFDVTPIQAAAYIGLNNLGELQGNGNIDALIVKLVAKKEAFSRLVNALGYRLNDDPSASVLY